MKVFMVSVCLMVVVLSFSWTSAESSEDVVDTVLDRAKRKAKGCKSSGCGIHADCVMPAKYKNDPKHAYHDHHYECVCRNGYSGKNCGTNICYRTKCQNGRISRMGADGVCRCATAATLKCYECTSTSSSSACADTFDDANMQLTTCDASATGCMKMKFDGQTGIVSRGCSPNIIKPGCISKTQNGVKGSFCSCTTDGCNSAGITKVSVVALLATVAVPFILFL